MTEYEVKKGPVRKAIDKAKAAALWLRNRRSAKKVANAIASNQLATAALAASVAAAGVGAYGTIQAYEAKSEAKQASQGVAGIRERLSAVESDIRLANVALAQAQYQLDVLKDKTTQGFRNLRSRLTVLVRQVDSTSRSLRNLPKPTEPKDYQPAIDRAKLLAENAQKAADQARAEALAAQNAAQEAAKNAVDPAARAAAQEAAQAASDAADIARDAQDAANDLKEEAADLQVQIDALPAQDHTYDTHTFAINGKTIADGQTVTFPVGELNVPADGKYNVTMTFQDGYGCNGDPFRLQLDGTTVAQFTSPYGNCGQISRTFQFNATAGNHQVSLQVGCLPPYNGACVVDGSVSITKVRN